METVDDNDGHSIERGRWVHIDSGQFPECFQKPKLIIHTQRWDDDVDGALSRLECTHTKSVFDRDEFKVNLPCVCVCLYWGKANNLFVCPTRLDPGVPCRWSR